MKKYRLIFFVVWVTVFLFLAVPQNLVGDDRNKAISIFENCIAYRNSIESMECILNVQRKLRNGSKTNGRLEIVLTGDKIRAKKLEDNRPIYLFVNCFQPNSFGFLNLQPNVLSARKPDTDSHSNEASNLNFAYLTLINNDALKNNSPEERARFQFFDWRDNALPNPRQMGQNQVEYVDLFGHNRSLDVYLQALIAVGSDIEVLDELIDSKNLTKVFFTLPIKLQLDVDIEVKSRFAFWFDLECGSTIRKISSSIDQTSLTIELSNEIQQDKRTGIWYPCKWKFVEKSGGYDLIEDYELEMVSINQPIAPKFFDLSSVKELIPGTNVRWELDSPPPAKGKLVWDGKKVVGISDYNIGLATARNWSSRRLFMICVNTAGISAIIAIACFRAWRRQHPMSC